VRPVGGVRPRPPSIARSGNEGRQERRFHRLLAAAYPGGDFLQIENFVVHPSGRGGQRTDADLLGIRFPHRAEFLFDHTKPMPDDVAGLSLSREVIDVGRK
jgi:hypothetical protein